MTVIFAALGVAAQRHAGIPVRDRPRRSVAAGRCRRGELGGHPPVVTAADAAPPAAVRSPSPWGACLASYLLALALLAPGLLSGALSDAAPCARAYAARSRRHRLVAAPRWCRGCAAVAAALLGALAAAQPGLAVALRRRRAAARAAVRRAGDAPAPAGAGHGDRAVRRPERGRVRRRAGQPRRLFSPTSCSLGGLARAALVLLDTPLERRAAVGARSRRRPCSPPPRSSSSTDCAPGTTPASAGAELRVLLGFGAAGDRAADPRDPAQRAAAASRASLGVGLAVGRVGDRAVDRRHPVHRRAGRRRTRGCALHHRGPRADPGRAVRVPGRGRHGRGGAALGRGALARTRGAARGCGRAQRGRSGADIRADVLGRDDARPWPCVALRAAPAQRLRAPGPGPGRCSRRRSSGMAVAAPRD